MPVGETWSRSRWASGPTNSRISGIGAADRLGVERPDLGRVDGGVDARLVVAECVDGQDAQDAVALGHPGGGEERLQALAGLARRGAHREQVVVRLLVGEHQDARMVEASPEDRPGAERRIAPQPEGVEVGPGETGLAALQEGGELRPGPRSKSPCARRGGSHARSPGGAS